jgi:hypothetical protein
LGEQVFSRSPDSPSGIITSTGDASSLSARALEHYNKAKEHLRNGNWAGYGKELENLEGLLNEMASKTPLLDSDGGKKQE